MFGFYHLEDIDLGNPTLSGHEAYLKATYYPSDGTSNPTRVIFKKNKHGKKQFSRLEVAFSQLARLFLASNLTSYQKLVLEESKGIVGIVVQHLCYVIEKKEGLHRRFFGLNVPLMDFKEIAVSQAEDIPIYFFDKLPQGFFRGLLRAEKEGELYLDYASLASILTSSYSLEEDDLHKGNYGFYSVEKEGKPQVVFFKIDHDLMFVDSIMSFSTTRPYHVFDGMHAFDITARDLISFPRLTDSANSYWPTRISHLPSYWDNKEYHHQGEVDAFVQLAGNDEFNREKWRCFFKHILIPTALIDWSLKECLDENDPVDRADLALITQSILGRQAQLKAALFSVKEFRDYVIKMEPQECESVLKEIVAASPSELSSTIRLQVEQSFATYKHRCQECFACGDTPLHIAIRLGDYRYEETIQMYGKFINVANSEGKTPLDLAREMLLKNPVSSEDVRKDLRFTMRHLLKYGAAKNALFNEFNQTEHIEDYKFPTPYINRAIAARSYRQFKTIIRDIGEEQSFCLKFKKTVARDCLERFIKVNKANPNLKSMLLQFKKDLAGTSNLADAAEVQFIRQLRSKLWIVRQLRGMYGRSATLVAMNQLIDEAIDACPASNLQQCSFFKGNPLPTTPENFSQVYSKL